MRPIFVSELPPNIAPPDFEGLSFNPKFCLGKMPPKAPTNPQQEAWHKFITVHIAKVPALSGTPKAFITKAAHGGRVLCKSGRYQDLTLLDFNSLYPFVLSKLEIPTGNPVVWEPTMCLGSYTYWILEIDIISMSPTPTGSMAYPYLKLGRRICDRFEIEDLVRYCGIEYSIVRGYVFGGQTVNCSKFITDLADKKQAASGEARIGYKNALNSIYGKCLFKGYKTEKHKYFQTLEAWQKYLVKNWQRVERFDAKKREVWLDRCQFNYAQIGVMILSMSKRIMNELFAECYSKGIDVVLSNTDSILIPTDKVSLLNERIGPALGQLHIEAQGDEVIIVRGSCYYLNENHWRCAGIPHKIIRETGDVKGWFAKQLKT
jgi:hypothetical protein